MSSLDPDIYNFMCLLTAKMYVEDLTLGPPNVNSSGNRVNADIIVKMRSHESRVGP